ncbi:MAG: hypothetical protein AB1449_07940 [Chloroflexota bacterium]
MINTTFVRLLLVTLAAAGLACSLPRPQTSAPTETPVAGATASEAPPATEVPPATEAGPEPTVVLHQGSTFGLYAPDGTPLGSLPADGLGGRVRGRCR